VRPRRDGLNSLLSCRATAAEPLARLFTEGARMNTNTVEIGRRELQARILAECNEHSNVDLSDEEADAIAGIALASLAASAGLTESLEEGSLRFDPGLRIRVEARLLDLFIAALVGAVSGTAVPSIGPKAGALAASVSYVVNCIPEIRNWIRTCLKLRSPKARLVAEYIRAAGPMTRADAIAHMRALGIPDTDCEAVIRDLVAEHLIRSDGQSVSLSVSEEAAQALRAKDSGREDQKKTPSAP